MNSEKWDEFLKEKQKALIFDTETSGLGYTQYDILSLSWQVINLHSWRIIVFYPFADNIAVRYYL